MKIYSIHDEESNLVIGTLLYYEREKSFIIELCDNLDEWTAPLIATAYVKKGIFTIPQDVSLMWVRERIIPSGRENIDAILRTHKLKAYDEMAFLEITEGRCSQDALFIRRIDCLPDYVISRQKKNVTEVVALDNRDLLCFFADGELRKINLYGMLDIEKIDKVINNDSLFNSVKISLGGYAITFNDSIEIAANRLYDSGISIPLSLNDFARFVMRNVFDTTRSCEELECTRQNMAYLLKRNQLHPIKENVKGNLYLKGEIESNKW